MAQKWHAHVDDMYNQKCYTCIVSKWDRTIGTPFSELKVALKAAFLLPKINGKEVIGMVKHLRKDGKLKTAYWSLVGIASSTLISLQPVMADTIWTRFSTIMKDIYGQLVGISTIVAVTVAAIALLVRMISRNQRAVDEATSWLKRIVVTWIVLNSLGFVVAYLQPLIAGGQYTG